MAPEEYLKQPYSRVLIPDAEGYSSEILEFPGCYAQGKTPEEAFKNLEEAALAWIESSLEQGHEIPPPSFNAGYGGKIALRLPRSIHRLAAQMAERDGVSLNQFLVSAIAARIGAEDLYDRIVRRLDVRIACTVGTGQVIWGAQAGNIGHGVTLKVSGFGSIPPAILGFTPVDPAEAKKKLLGMGDR